jgi:hypothetical protein
MLGDASFGIPEHGFDGSQGALPQAFLEFDAILGPGLDQDAQDILQRVRFHIPAHGAGTDEILFRMLGLQARDQSAFGEHQEVLLLRLAHMLEHLGGAAYVIGSLHHPRSAFGMGYHLHAGEFHAQESDHFGVVFLMNVAGAFPEEDLLAYAPADHFILDVPSHQLIGQEIDLVVGDGLDDVVDVGGCDANVALGLYVRGRIDVADEGVLRVPGAQGAHVVPGHRVRQGAARIPSGNKDFLVRVQDLGRLPHELHRREHDGLGRGAHGVLAQAVGIAGEIGHPVYDLRGHV